MTDILLSDITRRNGIDNDEPEDIVVRGKIVPDLYRSSINESKNSDGAIISEQMLNQDKLHKNKVK